MQLPFSFLTVTSCSRENRPRLTIGLSASVRNWLLVQVSISLESSYLIVTTNMENGQEETVLKTETQTENKTEVADETKINDANVEVKDEKPVSEECSPKVKSEEPSSELLDRIKNQIEVVFY